ncbi:PLP-dependent cysteine synthase family protein [Candidatus Mycalebacterium sp.]
MTPLLKLKTPEGCAEIWAKLENLIGAGNSKERICSAIIADAEKRGILCAGKTVVEATSGNTGVSLSLLCASKGYETVLFMPESVAPERKSPARVYGARIFETPANELMNGAVKRARAFAEENPDTHFFTDQFSNPLNPETHRRETAREIITQMKKTDAPEIDAFIMGVGTGGTITGVGTEIKKNFPDTEIVAVEPALSAVLSGGKAGKHSIPGIGVGFVPDVLDTNSYDRVITVTEDEARSGVAELARNNGLFAGMSSGANYTAAMKVALELGAGKRAVTIICDSGDRYLPVK